MKKYILHSFNSGIYSVYVIGLNYLSILSYFKELEREPLLCSRQGLVLVDQYLSTGDSDNRFVAINFFYGKIDLKSARKVKVDQKVKKLANFLLKQHKMEVENSILSEDQKSRILYGI